MDGEPLSQGGTGQPTSGEGGLSVPLGVHFAELRAADQQRFNDLRAADARWHAERDRRHIAEREGDKLAVDVALRSANELAAKHNDLIHAAERKDETYASKDDLSLLRVSVTRLGAVVAILQLIVLADFVAVWLHHS